MNDLERAARATDFLRVDHDWVKRLFNEYRAAMRSGMPRATIAAEILRNVAAHYRAEATCLLPAARGLDEALVERLLDEADVVHACVEELRAYTYDPPTRDILMLRLMDIVERHAADEEETLFPLLEAHLPRTLRDLHPDVVRARHAAHLGAREAA